MVLLAASLWLLGAGHPQPVGPRGLTLFSTQDATQLRLTDEDWQASKPPRSLAPLVGPRIVFWSPSVTNADAEPTIETLTPTDFDIRFEATQAPVDMHSLQVWARKGLFTKSLTPLLQPYIHGTSLQANAVKIPVGRFRLEMEIADIAGAKTAATYRLEVREP